MYIYIYIERERERERQIDMFDGWLKVAGGVEGTERNHTGVCEKNIPPEYSYLSLSLSIYVYIYICIHIHIYIYTYKACGKTGFPSAKSGAGERFLPLAGTAKAHPKGVFSFVTDTASAPNPRRSINLIMI